MHHANSEHVGADDAVYLHHVDIPRCYDEVLQHLLEHRRHLAEHSQNWPSTPLQGLIPP